jgi:hypothetical protein
MSAAGQKRRYWIWIPVALVLLLVLASAHFLRRDAEQVRLAVKRLGPGMTRPEVDDILRSIHEDVPMQSSTGQVEFLFYSVDEFVKIAMDKPGADGRVIHIEHMPDTDFTWDHLRRRCESSLRRLRR